MGEATEIAKLRLFLALVASARTVDQLEPLPNIDFNILPGNSLIGLLRVEAHEYDSKQDDLFRKTYRQVLDEKNRLVDIYRHDTVSWASDMDLSALKTNIETHKSEAQTTLDEILLDQWDRAGIRFEEATWDATKAKEGKPKKRKLNLADIQAQHAFHWGFEFDEILHQRGGFDAIITNPPWEVFQTDEKEFFQEFDTSIQKNKLRREDLKKQFSKFITIPSGRMPWRDRRIAQVLEELQGGDAIVVAELSRRNCSVTLHSNGWNRRQGGERSANTCGPDDLREIVPRGSLA